MEREFRALGENNNYVVGTPKNRAEIANRLGLELSKAAMKTPDDAPARTNGTVKIGRPLAVLQESEIARMSREGYSNRMIGDALGVDDKTIGRRFAAILAKNRSDRRGEILRKQNQLLADGNVAMAIWLGKQELGQSDKMDQNTQHSGTIAAVTYKVRKATRPENAKDVVVR